LPCRWPHRACDGNPLGEVFVGTLAFEKSRENYEQETIGFIPNEFIESFLNKNVFKTNSAMVEVETIFRLFVYP
jgi:hypothetical protein